MSIAERELHMAERDEALLARPRAGELASQLGPVRVPECAASLGERVVLLHAQSEHLEQLGVAARG